jgi:hypothetical protein
MLNGIQQWAKNAKGAIRTAVKKTIDFVFLSLGYSLFTCSECSAELTFNYH